MSETAAFSNKRSLASSSSSSSSDETKLPPSKIQKTEIEETQKEEEEEIQCDAHPLFPSEQLIKVQETELLPDETQMKINRTIKTILKLWESMPDQDQALILDTKKSLFPLCVQLRKSQISSTIQISLLTILLHIQRFEFREATQSYLKLSIGNVAWPIGVVNVSIHSRSNQSRLHGKEEANIMISEEARRWITAIKRMITFMEIYYKVNKEQYKGYVDKLKENGLEWLNESINESINQ